jgi:hypothetical protein
MNELQLDGNVGCLYFIRWENVINDNITTELLWHSNLDMPLEMMDEEELEETLEYIFNDNYGDVVKDVSHWDPNWAVGAYDNLGFDS